MHKYPHIDSLRHARDFAAVYLGNPRVRYRGTVKLHGSNAGVTCTLGALIPQSRNRVLSVGDDNAGFAAFVAQPEVQEAIRHIERAIRAGLQWTLEPQTPLTLYGEWCGPGIQKGVAVNALEKRQWVLFGVSVNGDLIDVLEDLMPEAQAGDPGVYCVHSSPTWHIDIDYGDPASIEQAAKTVTARVAQVEKKCPWAALFGVQGVGEGIVWEPVGEHWGVGDLTFKAKGEAHKVARTPRKISADPLVVAQVQDFVDMFVTDARLEQGLGVVRLGGRPLTMSQMGPFLKWFGADVQREGRLELEALTWKKVSKAVTAKARDWFKAQVLAGDEPMMLEGSSM